MGEVRPIGGARRKRSNGAPPPPSSGNRPIIRLGTELHTDTDAAVKALAGDGATYVRDHSLVHVVHAPEADPLGLAVGTPTIRPMAIATIREALSRSARWQKYDERKHEWRDAIPTEPVVRAVAARGEWPGLRPIVGILEAPALRPDGSVIHDRGYDVQTGYLYEPSCAFPRVSHMPGQPAARRALAVLSEPLSDFPWANDAARSAALAAVLTLLARPAIGGSCPAFVIDANTRGTGKSLLSDVIAGIATGRGAPRMSWPPDAIELEKVLAAYALRSATLVSFDNVTGTFGGGPLDRCLTADDRVELRVLGKSEVPSMLWRAVVLATGNNCDIAGDTARRVLLARLESPEENPEERSGFRHADLRGYVRAHRPQLVIAALTILRAYIAAGRPDVGTSTWGSFESWSALIPPALVFAGAADPLEARPVRQGREDTERMALAGIIEGWAKLGGPEGLTCRAAIGLLYSPEQLRGTAPPDGFDGLRDAIEAVCPVRPGSPPSTKKLGEVLRGARRRVIGGRWLVDRLAHGGSKRWTVEGGGTGGTGGTFPIPRVETVSDRSESRGGKGPTTPTSPTSGEEGQW